MEDNRIDAKHYGLSKHGRLSFLVHGAEQERESRLAGAEAKRTHYEAFPYKMAPRASLLLRYCRPGPTIASTLRLCLACLSFLAGTAHALDPDKRITQCSHTSWRIQDGSASSGMYSITETSDGFPGFLSSQGEMYRFDGVSFRPWRKRTEAGAIGRISNNVPYQVVSALLAQNPSALVTGRISDPNGASIPGAAVMLTGLDTGLSSKTETNAAGIYQVSGLIPGRYRIAISKDGFKSLAIEGIQLHLGETTTLNYELAVGSILESVTVEPSAVRLDAATTTVGQVIEKKQIEDTPLNGRNVMNLLALAPGVVPQGATSGPATNNQPSIGNYTNPAGWSNYQIGGGVAGQNALYLDGAPLNLPIQNWIGLIPAADSVSEFRVDTNNISGEFGRYYGGVISILTESGSNDFHGSAYEYFRNAILNANNFFNNRANIERPPLVQNQYGFALGGPVIQNKLFFFVNWEGYANRAGLPYSARVPTAAERIGDFTSNRPIFFTGTSTQISCNGVLNKVCPDATAFYMANVLKYWPLPNIPNAPEDSINFATNASSGSNSNQVTVRADYELSKHRFFGRYTRWGTNTLATNYFHNDFPQPAVLTTTHQAVLGDTYTINSTTFADVRLSFLRFDFNSVPPALGKVDLSKFPGLAPYANQVTFNVFPVPFLIGYSPSPFPLLVLDIIQFYTFNTYSLTGGVSKVMGKHTLKVGAELHRFEGYYSPVSPAAPTGTYLFVPGFPTTNVFANFMLGAVLPGASGLATGTWVSTYEPYGALYVTDIFKVTPKLTINAGVRWDMPRGTAEKHDLNTMLLPDVASPLGSIQNPATGTHQALRGNLALVNSSQYHSRHDDSSHYNLFAPSVGLAYRLFPGNVIRGGYTLAYLPNDTFVPSPTITPITIQTTPVLGTLSNPFPQLTNGILPQPIGRNPAYSDSIQGVSISGRVPNAPYPYVQQWNFNVQQQLSENSVLQVGYIGSKGTHLKLSKNLNALPDSVAAQAANQYQDLVASGLSSAEAEAQTFVNLAVANPLAGRLSPGSKYNGPTIPLGQLLRPYPQFDGVYDASFNAGNSIYHSLQASLQMRLRSTGTILVSYTWAKNIANVDSTTGFLEYNSVGGLQNPNNLSLDRSLTSFDVPHRLVLNYSLPLPFGKGRHWLNNAGPLENRLVSGWVVSGITTFQSGFPLALTAQPNALANQFGFNSIFGFASIRPDVVSSCQAEITGSAQSRLNEWFNTTCYDQPRTPFSIGNASRTDPVLRTAGINNWDLALTKETSINKRFRLLVIAQFLNLFNRVQFGQPGVQVGSIGFGEVTSQVNNPRQIQFGLRLAF
jgi:Carboxypeptidase regulatory-like domain